MLLVAGFDASAVLSKWVIGNMKAAASAAHTATSASLNLRELLLGIKVLRDMRNLLFQILIARP